MRGYAWHYQTVALFICGVMAAGIAGCSLGTAPEPSVDQGLGADLSMLLPTDAAIDASVVSVGDMASLCGELPDGGGPLLIASGQKNPTGIAVDGTMVYWANSGDGTVVKCPLAGCQGNPISVGKGSAPFSLLVDGNSVYWVNLFSSIQKCPLAGCGNNPPVTYAKGNTKAAGIAINATTLYWTEVETGYVASCPLAGCDSANVLYAGPAGPSYGIAMDSSYLYWLNNYTADVLRAPLMGVPDGGTPMLLAHGTGGEAFATIDSSQIYWTEYSEPGSVLAVPLTGLPDGGTPQVFASGQAHPKGIVVDKGCGKLYWVTSGTGKVNDAGVDPSSAVFRCSASGCSGSPTVFAPNQRGPIYLTQDHDYVYWSNYSDGTVWRQHK